MIHIPYEQNQNGNNCTIFCFLLNREKEEKSIKRKLKNQSHVPEFNEVESRYQTQSHSYSIVSFVLSLCTFLIVVFVSGGGGIHIPNKVYDSSMVKVPNTCSWDGNKANWPRLPLLYLLLHLVVRGLFLCCVLVALSCNVVEVWFLQGVAQCIANSKLGCRPWHSLGLGIFQSPSSWGWAEGPLPLPPNSFFASFVFVGFLFYFLFVSWVLVCACVSQALAWALLFWRILQLLPFTTPCGCLSLQNPSLPGWTALQLAVISTKRPPKREQRSFERSLKTNKRIKKLRGLYSWKC